VLLRKEKTCVGDHEGELEIQWSDILSIRASTVANEPGILEIEVLFLFLFSFFK